MDSVIVLRYGYLSAEKREVNFIQFSETQYLWRVLMF